MKYGDASSPRTLFDKTKKQKMPNRVVSQASPPRLRYDTSLASSFQKFRRTNERMQKEEETNRACESNEVLYFLFVAEDLSCSWSYLLSFLLLSILTTSLIDHS